MSTTSKRANEVKESRERTILLKHKFQNRITIARFGKEFLDAGDYANALHKFTEYMQTMAETKKVKDMYSLSPANFESKKDLTEMLMISHVYFEMAKVFDAVPNFKEDSKKCLEQFVKFTVNQPYQIVNSELVRKNLKRNVLKHPENFRAAYGEIYVQSKKCYVVTFCFGDEHPVTNDFRALKDCMLETSLGRNLVRIYYQYSSEIVPRWENNSFAHLCSKVFLRPLLLFLSKTLVRIIIK